jgi:hypothetical protein
MPAATGPTIVTIIRRPAGMAGLPGSISTSARNGFGRAGAVTALG